MDDFVYTAGRYVDILGQLTGLRSKVSEIPLTVFLRGVLVPLFWPWSLLMIVFDLDLVGISFLPSEAYSPLVVYTYAVLAFSVADKPFQLISRWNSQVIQFLGSIEQQEFSESHPIEVLREPWYRLSQEDLFSAERSEPAPAN